MSGRGHRLITGRRRADRAVRSDRQEGPLNRSVRCACAALLAAAALAAPAQAETRVAVAAVGTPGGPALTAAAAPVSLWQVALGAPSYGSFAKLPITLTGDARDEGKLAAAPDGSILMAGYDSAPGSPTADAARVVAQVGPTGTVTTPTRLTDAFAGGQWGSVPAALALSLGAAPAFGAFTPGITQTYRAATTATVTSTAGDAALTASDPGAAATGHLVIGAFALPPPLQVAGAVLPATVASWAGPLRNGVLTVDFTQAVAATDALRTGSYAKTLTFTLSTTSPQRLAGHARLARTRSRWRSCALRPGASAAATRRAADCWGCGEIMCGSSPAPPPGHIAPTRQPGYGWPPGHATTRSAPGAIEKHASTSSNT